MGVNFEELAKTCDFSGWATMNDYLCTDGRTIRKGAFSKNHGKKVPLMWNHQHGSIDNVLGHAFLQEREKGVYAYCFANDTDDGKIAKQLVRNGDISALSIWANELKQKGGDVLHGDIKELSLVLAGANRGAVIDNPIAHDGINNDQSEAIIRFVLNETVPVYNSLKHSDEGVDDIEGEEFDGIDTEELAEDITEESTDAEEDAEDNNNSEETEAEEDIINESEESDMANLSHADGEKTVGEIFNAMTEEQKNVVYFLIGQALEENEGDDTVKHNEFDNNYAEDSTFEGSSTAFAHSDEEIRNVFTEAIEDNVTSLRRAFLSHGITEIESLFPDYKSLNNPPDFIKRPDGWVAKVMNGVHRTPFSRIRSVFADITADEARAKGFVKGGTKTDEQFGLLRRTTDPTTVYKKQSLHRDDVLDITDFDVVAWLKVEMRFMLEEELARAILVGDGRSNQSPDKIDETKIRPIWKDASLYVVNTVIELAANVTSNVRADTFIDAEIRAHEDYRGSGNPTLFIDQTVFTDMLLLKDTLGRRIYTNATELATSLLVKEIVPVPVMKNQTRTVTVGEGQNATTETRKLMGIVVNLIDYNVGADKGGAVSLFDDFDIDLNKQKYLIETRMSGALVKPYSAIVIESKTAS